jgi:predicted RNA-binding protein with RPS1 domain
MWIGGTNGDFTVFVEGYKDRKGIVHITKVDAVNTNI